MQQVRLDELVQVPVQHCVHVAHLEIGAVILDQAVGLEDIGADLASPGDVLLGAVEGLGLLLLLPQLQLIEAGFQHLQGHGAVLVLGPLVLALHDDARGIVRDAHCRLGPVHVLAPGPAGPERVDLQVRFLDLDLRLGEGTGAALGIFLAEAATRILADMATFAEAGVSKADS